MFDFASYPALWGLAGATTYAGAQLVTALWSGETAPTERARKLAWSRFVLAEFFGPVAAAALTMPIIDLAGRGAAMPVVALAVGLCANALWPVFVTGIGKEAKRAFASMFKRLGSAIDGDDV